MNKVLAIAGIVIKELYRRKDFYVLLVLTALITGVLGAMKFFNDQSIVRYLKEACLLLIWISSLVICITTAARQIPAERENRTIFPLLAKPVTRWEFVFGKFAGCWFACGIALLVFYLFFAVVSESRAYCAVVPAVVGHANESITNAVQAGQEAHEGHDHDSDPHAEHDTEPAHATWLVYFQALWLHWMFLGVVTAVVLLGSVVFTAPSSNTTISFIGVLGILYLGEFLHKVALRQSEPVQTLLSLIYFVIPHLEWCDIRRHLVYDRPPIELVDCGLNTLYQASYAGLFLLLTWLVFRRKGLTT